MKKDTHEVLDLVYTKEEGQECFSGSYKECVDFVDKQGGVSFAYKIVPIIRTKGK